MGLNHIYKVIWSKTKNAWVVVSEIAKRDGKSSVKSVVTSLAGKSVAAVMVAMVMCGGVASAATGTQYGTGATAAYNTSVAVGENAQATNSGVTLVGANSQIQGQYSTVVGINNKDYGTSTNNNEILGSVNNVKGQHNIIVGNGTTISSQGNASSISSDAEGNYNVALGDFQSIGGDKNISILSDGYRLRGKQNISIGYGSHVGDSRNAEFALAIGAASAQGNNTVAIGHSALAENVHNSDTSIAIGTLAQASDSIAIGSNSSGPVSSTRAYLNAQGSSVNIGFRNAIANNKSVILGTNNNYGFGGGVPVSTDGGVVIGHDNYISSAKNEIIIGSENNTNGESQIAIGTNIQSNTHLGGVKGAVAIGYNSEFATLNKPSGTLNINGVNLDASNYAGNSSSLTYGNTFSIGKLNNERQLKNVAAGEISSTSTDAINGSQLYEAVRAVSAGASPDVYMHVNDGTTTQGAGNATTNLGKANEKGGATGNRSIAIGVGSQASGQNSVVIGSEVKSTSANIVAIGNPAASWSAIGTNSMGATLIGYNSVISDNSGFSSVFGANSSVLGTSSVAINNASVNGTNSVAINGKAGRFQGINQFTSNNAVAINGVAKGNNNIAIGGSVGYSNVGDSYLVSGSNFSTPSENSIAIGNNTLVTQKNTVMVGTYDKEYTAKANSDKNKVITPALHTTNYTLGAVDKQYYEGTLNNSIYLGHESYAFTPDALVDDESHLTGEQSIHTKKYDAAGNIVVSNNTTGGAFGKVSKATINGDEITGFAGAQSVGAVTIGAGDYERRIQNVAAGEVSATSTDGINGSQLYAVANTLSKNMSSYMHINDGTSTQTVGNATTNYGYSGSKAGATGNLAIAGGMAAKASGEEAIAIGSGAKASGEKSISIGTGNEVKGNKSSAIGDPSYIDTTATGTHVQGNDNGTATNPIKASESTFMGNTNLAGTAGTTGIHVVGNSNSVDSSNVMVMGNGVNVGTGLDGAVVLGNASSADQYAAATDSTINGVTFEAAGYAGNTGLNNGSIVSVGATGTERQIKNVAAGAVTATSTDAVNGSQLYKTAETILKMPINMAGDSGDTVGLKLGKTVNIKGSVASGADVTDGNIAVVGDKATSTLSLKMAKNLTGLTSGTFTDATGNQTVINGAGVTVTPTGTGATPISITTSGINAGNQEIKGVKKGTTDDAAVNKKQMDDALAGISSTLTINDGTTDGSVNLKTGKLKVVGESGANALVTTTVSGDTINVGTSTKLQNAVTAAEKSADKDLSNLSTTGSDKVKTLAQDAVKVAGTGLATVSDATAAGVKTYTVNVDEGKLVIDDTTGKVGAAGASQGTVQGKDGVATTQNVASVVNSAIDKTKQALDDAKHNFAGDDATVISRKHGEQLNIKGGASTTATDLTSGNIAVVGDTTSGTLNIKMAKALTGLTSATYTDAAGNTQTVTGGSSTIADAAGNSTVVSKGGVTTTDGTNTTTVAPAGVTATDGTNTVKLNGSGIDAGNTEIKHVGKATTDDAAVNKKQMDDALKGATDNTVSLGSESGSTTAKKLSTTGGIKFNIKGETGANALITTSATGDDVTIAPTAKLTAAVTAAEKSADKDLSNLSAAGDTYIKNLAKTAASWKVETNGAGTTAVAGGDTVNFIDGDNIAITNTGRSITIGTAKNVSFDKVTVGGIVLDKTDGINAGGKEIKGVATGTAADSAVNKAQMDAAITAAAGGSLSTEKVVAKTLTGDNNLATVAGQTGTAKGETYEVSVSENAVKAVAATAAQDAVKVAGTGLATVSDATAAGVKTYTVNVDEGKLVIDDTTGKIGANGATQGTTQGKNGVATTQDVASVVNSAIDKTKQALDDAKHNFAGDDATVISRKHGEQLNIKGGASTTATDLTSGNIAVVGDTTTGTLNIKLAKALTGLTSATYTDAAGNTQTVTGGSSTITDGAGNTTTITKGGMTTTDGTNTTTVAPAGVTATDGTNTVKLNGSGIDAGNTQIKNVGKATTDDAAVNKKQMDDAVKAATDSISTLGDNKVSLGSDSGTTTAKKLSTTGGIKFNIKGDTGANALITTSATGDDVTIAPTAKLSAAVTAAENSANKDLSNLSTAGNTYIQNLAKSAASWNVETNGASTTAVAGGDTVNFINGDNIAITNTGRSITIGTAKNVSFDKVTVGGVVIDKNNGIDAGGKEITNVGPATSGNSAVNKTQMDTAITNAVNKATTDAKHDFGGDDATVVTRKHGEKLNIKGGASTTAADLTSGNIAVLGDAATGTLNIRMAKALTGLSSATFTTPSGTTVINGGGMTITPSTTGAAPISITTGGINAGNTEIKNVAAGTTPNSAVNKQQMDSAISNATANVGFNTAGNTGTGSVSNGQTLSITGTNGIETNASGQSITVGLDAATRAQINNATTTANNAAKKDLSNIDNAGKQVIKNTAAWNVKVNGAAAETVKGGDTVTFNDGDNIKVTNTGKDITIATKKDVSFDKVTVGNVVIDKNTNRISGLANAANNDEAVNLGQMNAAISTATAGTGNIKYKANGGTQNSVALTTGFDFKGDSNIQITADPANSGVINYKLNPALTGITSISGGTGAPTITLNAGSGSTPGNVSINSNLDMGGKQINNIGAATHAGDAVNKAQMDQALQNIAGASSNAAKSYAYKAGAGAAALAALKPIQYDPLEPTQIMAGIGNYKSQTAVALGVAHYTNENTMFNLGVSLDSHDGIVNAGVTHKFGYSPEKKAIPDKYKGGPISSIYVMQDEVTALQAIVQKQAAENEALRQQNEDMQRKVDMILSKIH